MNAIETLKAICKARAKATAGLWFCAAVSGPTGGGNRYYYVGPDIASVGSKVDEGRFIAIAGSIDWPTLLAEVQRLQAIVDKLPKTEDGVSVTSSDDVYELIDGKTIVHSKAGRLMWPVLWPVYSTREAAEAAAKKGQ